jgi:N-ethylmaleimide reductase
MSKANIFDSTTVGALQVANRIAMAPLTRSRADLSGNQTPLAAEYYRQRASAGLLFTEATDISRQGHGFAYTPGIYTDAHVAAWQPVTEAVHNAGCLIVLQLLHVGRISHVSLQENGQAPVAPSAIQAGEQIFSEKGPVPPSMPRALRIDEIPPLLDDYRSAARKAKTAGFDGVEIHMGNGFLLDQFLRDSTNHRDDSYGGSVQNRIRLPFEVARAVADIWGPDRVGVRLSPVKTSLGNTPLDSDPQATFGQLVEKLDVLGLAFIHCIEGDALVGAAQARFDFHALRKAFSGAYIANGGYHKASAEKAILEGRADVVAFGRPFIGNPDFVERLRRDAPLIDAPSSVYYGGGEKGYIDFPTLMTSSTSPV